MARKSRSRKASFGIRKGRLADIDTLLALERSIFTVDHLSRRSFRNFLMSPLSVLMVAVEGGEVVGYVHVLFRTGSRTARLYSIGVVRRAAGRGIGIGLLRVGERTARRRGARLMRLEVQPANRAAIARYEKSGYRRIGRLPGYYNDGGDALRYEKILVPG